LTIGLSEKGLQAVVFFAIFSQHMTTKLGFGNLFDGYQNIKPGFNKPG